MSLSTLAGRGGMFANPKALMTVVRSAGTVAGAPAPSKNQWKPPASEVGFFQYERDYSRDPRYANPQKQGDTTLRMLTRKLSHAYEVYPIIGLCGIWFGVFCYAIYISFDKIEVWFDRSHKDPSWDWERVRNNYWKKQTLVFDPEGVTHRRLPIMEQLQDAMVEAAKSRGTR